MVQTQPVQIDVDMNYHDVLELLRPKMVVFESLEQANAAVQVREDAPSLGTALYLRKCSPALALEQQYAPGQTATSANNDRHVQQNP